MKASKTSKAWMKEHVNDFFVKQAKKDGYRSRAAYKLLEINERDHLLKTGMTVIDLGAAPGGWSQIAANKVGQRGTVIALDLLEIAPLPGVICLQGDFREDAMLKVLENHLQGNMPDLVISDMAPNMSGIAVSDQARSMHLAELALLFCIDYLKPGGRFLVKTFQGRDFDAFLKNMRLEFDKVVIRKPKASRDRSKELYLLGLGKKSA